MAAGPAEALELFPPPKPELGVGGLLGILLWSTAYLGAGLFLGESVRKILSGGAGELISQADGKTWFLVGLNVVGLACLALLLRKVPSQEAMQAEDLGKRPWWARTTSLPITERVAFFTWSAVYLAAIAAGLIL